MLCFSVPPIPADASSLWKFDAGLFASVFLITFVAELPDKTAFAALILATRANPWALFLGSAGAFLIQSVIAVACGSLVGLLPPGVIKVGSGLVFIALALFMWFRHEPQEEELHLRDTRGRFLRTIGVSFVVIFIAEWGDLTQFSTAILAAKYGRGKLLTVFVAATLALWAVTALAIALGNRAGKLLRPKTLKRAAAVALAVVGGALLLNAAWGNGAQHQESSNLRSSGGQVPCFCAGRQGVAMSRPLGVRDAGPGAPDFGGGSADRPPRRYFLQVQEEAPPEQ